MKRGFLLYVYFVLAGSVLSVCVHTGGDGGGVVFTLVLGYMFEDVSY